MNRNRFVGEQRGTRSAASVLANNAMQAEYPNNRYKCQLGKEFYHACLTRREVECMYYLLRGQTAKGTANVLGLSRRTVESYIENVKGKLCCNSKSQLVSKILESGSLPQLEFIWSLRNKSVPVY